MDVVSLPKMKKHFRAMIDNHGRIEFVEVKPAESKWKLVRIQDKRIIKGGKTQLNLHDGTNILYDKKVKTGDVLQITLPDMKVKTVIEFKKGAQALITGGAHVGSISKVKDIEVTRNTKPNLVMYDGFQTIKDYTFVVGDKKAMVSLPEVKV